MADFQEIGFLAFGVPVVVAASDPAILPRIAQRLPPGWERRDQVEARRRYTLLTQDGVSYWVKFDRETIAASSDLEVALEVLETQIRAYVALNAPDLVFVHAGVAAVAGRAIIVPGVSFSGKSTLVAELVRAGATYYSDEFAVLDDEGRTLPYAKPLSMRNGTLTQTDHDVEAFGGVAGDGPVPVSAVVVTRYLPGAQWQPKRVSSGQGVLALMANTIPARERPAACMAAIARAVDGAVVLEGERGDAAPVVEHLLELLG